MQQCPNCQQELTSDALARGFCQHCGARIPGPTGARISLSLQRATYSEGTEEKAPDGNVREPDAPPTLGVPQRNPIRNLRDRLQNMMPRRPNEQPEGVGTRPSGEPLAVVAPLGSVPDESPVASAQSAPEQQAPDATQDVDWSAQGAPPDDALDPAAFAPSYPFSPAPEEPLPAPEPQSAAPQAQAPVTEEPLPPAPQPAAPVASSPDFLAESYSRPPEPIAAPPPPPIMLPAEPAPGPASPYVPSSSQSVSPPVPSGPQQPQPLAQSGPIPYPDPIISQPIPAPYQTPGYPITGPTPAGYPGVPYSGPAPAGYPGTPYSGPTPIYSPPNPAYSPMGPGIYQQQGSGIYGQTGALPPIEAPPRRARRQRRRTGRGFFVGFLTAIILIAGASGALFVYTHPNFLHTPTTAAATPTSTPSLSPTPTIQTGFTMYSSPDGIYRIAYPSNWEIVYKHLSDGSPQATIRSLDSADAVMIQPSFAALTPDQYSSTMSNLLKNLSTTHTQIASNTDSVTIGANTWTSIMATADANGTSYQFVLYGLDHNGNTAIVLTSAPDSNAGSVDAQYFQPMLQSFSFQS
jgi:hypothetical protein